MQMVLWDFALGFSGPASAITSFVSVASHPIVPGCLQTAGSGPQPVQAAMLRRDDALDVMHWVICSASVFRAVARPSGLAAVLLNTRRAPS